MKKLILSVAVVSALLLTSCGPSAEEIAKKEQLRLDSIAQVEAEAARVSAEAETARLAEEAKQKATQDSTKRDRLLCALSQQPAFREIMSEQEEQN